MAASAAVLTVVMIVVYLLIVRQQSNQPAGWFLAVLLAGAVAAGYASFRGSPHRRAVLVLAGIFLTGAGLLALLSIGLPILTAGILCEIAAARSSMRGSSLPTSTS
ncbi:MAG TPA: hypothetical protein VHN80_21410 [Kineosporiaceae bacterium]|nr:hypothetical protein [Kineosporiaceae bacterium]